MRIWRVIALAIALIPAVGNTAIDAGWREVVISVNSTDQWARYWRDVNGYEVLYQGRGDARLYDGLEHTVTLLRNPGSDRGYVRLVQFDAAGEAIRANAQSWDVGGCISRQLFRR